MKDYNAFNESRRHKNRQKPQRNRGGNLNTMRQNNQQTPRLAVPRGMPMVISPRLKYILTKIDKKGNKIAKDLLSITDKLDARFENSYLEITKKPDSLSYLPNGARDIPEADRFTSNKRQVSQIYKVVKNIFSGKYTKNEVTKFVSFYKEAWNQGPPRESKGEDKAKLTEEETIKKVIEDTKSDKLKWAKEAETKQWDKWEAIYKITDNKNLEFEFYFFKNGVKEEAWTFLSLHLINKNTQVLEDKNKHLNTFKFELLLDFIKLMKDKYKVDAQQ